jgi:perosamine synthetase
VKTTDTIAPQLIPYGQHSVTEDDIAAVVQVLREGPLTQGPRIETFERSVAAYVGAKYAVAVSSGTAALHLACLAAGLKPGGRLITSPITFVASANCALYAGAQPAFADIDPLTLNLSPVALKAVCQSLEKVDVILPVHFAGLPCDMPAIQAVARQHQARIIEDAAHALGATYPQGGRVGNCAWSDMTIFSFHPVKIIAAGEGGMITTNDPSLYRRLLRLRSHGINKLDDSLINATQAYTAGESNPWYYEMQELGFNYRMTDIQAALAASQLARIDQFLARRREIAEAYDAAFANFPVLTVPQQSGRRYSAHHLYTVRINFTRLKKTRSTVMRMLHERGVGTQVHYIPVYAHPYYSRFGFRASDYPQAEGHYSQTLSLPMFFALSTSDQNRVIETLQEILS